MLLYLALRYTLLLWAKIRRLATTGTIQALMIVRKRADGAYGLSG